jgi:hypothetical protein
VLFSIDAPAQDARIAIVDSSDSTKPYVQSLAALGVVVIGRYYGRCPQRIVPEKRMIDNLGEISAILHDKRLGMLSIYQFYSQDEKFDSNRSSGKVSALDDRPRNPHARTVEEFNDCITPDRPNTIEDDAKLDGYAAVVQAKDIAKQPSGTAIYFGADFDVNESRKENVLKYFRIVNTIVTNAGYILGVYGNGAISDVLRRENLVKRVWLSASPGHAGSVNAYNTGHWDLLQTKTDVKWSIAGKAVELDTDIQNPKSADAGFWNKAGLFLVPRDRNGAIYGARRFVCEGRPVVVNDSDEPVFQKACMEPFGAVVRTFEINASKKLVRVDCDEDGKPDGWMKVRDLSTTRPVFIYDKNARLRAHCINQ